MKYIVYSLLFFAPFVTQASFEHTFAQEQITIVKQAAEGEYYSRAEVLNALTYISAHTQELKILKLVDNDTFRKIVQTAQATQALLSDLSVERKHKHSLKDNAWGIGIIAACSVALSALYLSHALLSDYERTVPAAFGVAFLTLGAGSSAVCVNDLYELISFSRRRLTKLDNINSIIETISKLDVA